MLAWVYSLKRLQAGGPAVGQRRGGYSAGSGMVPEGADAMPAPTARVGAPGLPGESTGFYKAFLVAPEVNQA